MTTIPPYAIGYITSAKADLPCSIRSHEGIIIMGQKMRL